MFKSRVWFFSLLVALLAGCGNNPTPAAPPLFIQSNEIRNDQSFVNFNIDEVTILKETGDLVGQGEFRLLIIGADTNGRSSGTFCPGDKPIKIRVGSTIDNPCLFVLGFNEETVSDGVFLMVIAVDEDESSLPADLSYELVANKLGEALGKAVVAAGGSNPYVIGTQVLVSYLGGKVKDWFEKADTIGSQGIFLNRGDNWSVGKQSRVTSQDSGMELVYSVIRSSTQPEPQVIVITQVLPTAKQAQPTSIPPTEKAPSVAGTATISCANRLYFVMLRRSPGYNNKNDATDKVAEVPCGEEVLILGESKKKDGLNWYPVSWNGLEGWMADYTSSGKKILIFD